jgi:hypothetical protein
MADITDDFLQAALRTSFWADDAVQHSVELIAKAVGEARIDWEPECGEAWARVIDDATVYGLVWRRGPFVLLAERVPERTHFELVRQGVIVREFEDWDSRSFTVDIHKLKAAFPETVIREEEELASSEFSVSDLWWSTV